MGDQFIRKFKVNDTEVEFTIDTGAEVSLMTEDTAYRLKLRYSKPDRMLVAANGSSLTVVGKSEVTISNKGMSSRAVVHICKGLRHNLLGIWEIAQ